MERDLRRLETHYGAYDGLMARMKKDLERGQKERMMTRIERDKLKERIRKLEDDLTRTQQELKDSQRDTDDVKASGPSAPTAGKRRKGKKAAAAFPPPPSPPNPLASASFPVPTASSLQSLALTKTFPAHQAAICALAFHPTKSVLCTASDDATWKLWGTPRGELLMTGEGHQGWVSEVRFVGAAGRRLVSGGGDGAVKLWDLVQAECVETYGGGGGGQPGDKRGVGGGSALHGRPGGGRVPGRHC